MTIPSESDEAVKPRSMGRFILSEGVLLALSSAAAYAVAFMYETGYAGYFRYPYWLIEVSWINVLLVWGALLISVIIFLMLALPLVHLIPASAVGVLTSRFAGLLGALAFIGAGGWYLMSVRDEYWVGLFSFLSAGGLLSLFVVQVLRIHRIARREGTWLTRWAITVRVFGASRPAPDTSLATALLGYKIFGWPVATLLNGFFVALCLAILPAAALGRFKAESDQDFLVTHQVFEWVAVRRYGDRLLAMRLYPKTMALTTQYVVFPLSDPARVWSLRHLDRLQVSAWQGR